MPLQESSIRLSVNGVPLSGTTILSLAMSLAADTENTLYERTPAGNGYAFFGKYLDNFTFEIGLHLYRYRMTAQQHLTGDVRDRLDGSLDLGFGFRLEQSEE